LYRTWALPAAIVTVLSLAACGGGGSTDGTTATASGGQTVKAAGEAGKGAATGQGAAAGASPALGSPAGAKAGDPCQARLADFIARMNDLRQSLLAGLSYDEYVVRVRAIRAAYEAVPVERLGAACVTGPAADAEDAFNQYLRAANAWGECAATAGCAASEVEGRLQRRWKIASKSLDAAEKQS
jgi:hypothetical protein